MNNSTLDQRLPVGAKVAANATTKVQKKSLTTICEGTILERLVDFAFSVPDFRRTSKGNCRHKLGDVILLIILARMSRCSSRADIIEFGRHNLNKIRSMGILRNGVPSEPTLCRIENGIDEQGLADRMAEFAQSFHAELVKVSMLMEIICLDGKAMRGTVQENGRNPDIVSAYSHSTRIILATEACHEKSNEIKAFPILIDKIDIAGKLVTADAMSMQKDIVDKIIAGRGYFLIELKANQRSLRYGVEDRIKGHEPRFVYTEGPGLGHGRIETRTYKVYDGLELIADKDR